MVLSLHAQHHGYSSYSLTKECSSRSSGFASTFHYSPLRVNIGLLIQVNTYMSCLVLLHSSAQMLHYGYPQNIRQQELSYAKSCLDVLEYCGTVDKVTLCFAEITRSY